MNPHSFTLEDKRTLLAFIINSNKYLCYTQPLHLLLHAYWRTMRCVGKIYHCRTYGEKCIAHLCGHRIFFGCLPHDVHPSPQLLSFWPAYFGLNSWRRLRCYWKKRIHAVGFSFHNDGLEDELKQNSFEVFILLSRKQLSL